MNASFSLLRSHLSFINLVTVLVLLFTLTAPSPGLAQKIGSPETIVPDPIKTDQLQFKSENHIASFEPTLARLVGVNHMLEIEFFGTHGVQPISSVKNASAGLAALEQVTYANLWQGITVTYTKTPGGIAKSEYRVEPFADPASIQLRYNIPPALNEDGSLAFAFDQAEGVLTESAPVAWQVVREEQIPVNVAFQVTGNEVGFTLGAYDPAFPLIIDPAYTWHGFYGGKPAVELVGACMAGNLYYAVANVNAYIQQDKNPLASFYHGGKDIAVFTADAIGIWKAVSYFGSDLEDEAKSVACGTNNDFYIVGNSAKTWKGPGDVTPINAHNGGTDITVIALYTTGNTVDDLNFDWHTFLGSSSSDSGRDIAVNGSFLYVGGTSYNTWNGNGVTAPKHAFQGEFDLVAIKLTAANGTYQWHTFYGDDQGDDSAAGIASVGSDVWLVGTSNVTWKGPLTTDNPKHAHSGQNEAVILKLDTNGNYVWHTFYGAAASNEVASAVVLHPSNGTGYVVGYGEATWNGDGTGVNTPLHAHSGGSDSFVLSLNSAGAYQWHTFYGSSSGDEGRGIERDTNGNLLVVGYSASTWNAPTAPVIPFGGHGDGFFLQLNSSGAYVKHEFYGGSSIDALHAINMTLGSPFLLGFSDGSWNGPADQLPKEDHTGTGNRNGVFIWLSSLAYSKHSFLNTLSDDQAAAIAGDNGGNLVVVGSTAMSWLAPGNINPLKKYNGGGPDLLILKLTGSGGYLWHTIYGGELADTPVDVVTDGSNNIYVLGTSNKPWVGPAGESPIRAHSNSMDMYVLKLNASGTYLWHTFMGSSSADEAMGMFYSSSSGMLYIVGKSYANWPGLTPKHTHSGELDAVIAGLNPSTGAYMWHTFYGQSGDDNATAIYDHNSNVYVTGASDATWTGPGGQAPKHAHDGSSNNAFILKLDPNGNYNWHTFYGNRAYGNDILVDNAGSPYVLSTNQTAWNGPDGQLPTHTTGEYGFFLMKLTSTGNYVWHGFFGGGNSCMIREMGYSNFLGLFSIVCEALQEMTGDGTPQNAFQGGRDVVLLQVTNQGAYKRHTYFGSELSDYVGGLVLPPDSDHVLIAGSSLKTWSYKGNAPDAAFIGGKDIFVIDFAPLSKSVKMPAIFK